ncbi:MAG: hypothetical protein V8T36_10465 [Ruthenibacterium lactatiformans]
MEHLVLGMMDAPNAAVKEVLRQFSLDKPAFWRCWRRCAATSASPATTPKAPMTC